MNTVTFEKRTTPVPIRIGDIMLFGQSQQPVILAEMRPNEIGFVRLRDGAQVFDAMPVQTLSSSYDFRNALALHLGDSTWEHVGPCVIAVGRPQ